VGQLASAKDLLLWDADVVFGVQFLTANVSVFVELDILLQLAYSSVSLTREQFNKASARETTNWLSVADEIVITETREQRMAA
jgi:hypothetical protein